MADEDNAPLAGGGESAPVTTTQDIEDKLGSFDFDAAPAGATTEPKQSQEDQAASPAGEATESEPTQSDDDPEISLRDNSKVKLSELKRGYLPDWQKKTQEFSQYQQAMQAKIQGFTQQEQQIAQVLQHAVAFVEQHMPKEPDAGLIDSDPFEYQRQKANYDVQQGKLQQIQQQRMALAQNAQKRQQYESAVSLQKEREATFAAFPHLKDPVKATEFYEKVKKLGAELGYHPREMSQINDSRLVRVLDLAVKAKEYEAALERVKAKQKEAKEPIPQVQSPSRRRSPAEVRNEQHRAQLNRLSKTGRNEDAEKFLSNFE